MAAQDLLVYILLGAFVIGGMALVLVSSRDKNSKDGKK